MELVQDFEDVEIRRLLSGNERDVAEAFDRLDKSLRVKFMNGARRCFRWMCVEDVADAWQETMKDLLAALRAGRLDLLRDIRSWLWTVFRRKTFDQMGRVERQRTARERVAERLRGTSVGALVEGLGWDDRSKLMARIRGVVDTLPPRQKLVIQTFLEEYPSLENREDLRRRVSERAGREETPASVRRAFQEARVKIASLLRQQAS
jgi:DNA-directed RNA polymerase specialized sigma24 family protein